MKETSSLHSDAAHWDLVQRYVDDQATVTDMADLECLLLANPDFRAAFLDYLSIDSALGDTFPPDLKKKTIRPFLFRHRTVFPVIGLACAAAIAVLAVVTGILPNPFAANRTVQVASIGNVSDDVRWLSAPLARGNALDSGTSLQLASGNVEVHFQSGALTLLHGPAHLELVSNNSAFLHYGEAFSRADNEESQGFTIQTHSGNFVDRGTEFLTTARTDGFSQLHVTSGAVDVDVAGHERQRLRTGSGLGIEPGEIPVLIRIETGDETPAFQFPTIPPPTDSDFADQRQGNTSVEWLPTDPTDKRNHLAPPSGPVDLVIDGRAQSGEDEPAESLFFRDGANGLILIDLGREVPVSKINTYSWHRNLEAPDLRRRAVQRYTLWGCGAEKPPAQPNSEINAGWTRIARVNTDAFFGVREEPDRPPQQACSIFSGGNKAIGSFRYLLFEVSPTPMPEGMRPRHTFFGEIDIFTTTPQP
jgi:hypothetical protein